MLNCTFIYRSAKAASLLYPKDDALLYRTPTGGMIVYRKSLATIILYRSHVGTTLTHRKDILVNRINIHTPLGTEILQAPCVHLL